MRTIPLVVGLLTLTAAVPLAASGGPMPPAGPAASDPLVVVGLVDTGINPYHASFRWDDPRAYQHPCKWLPGYPCDAIALPITLDAATYAEAYAADKPLWDNVLRDTTYWIPGTKVVAARSHGNGGVNCPHVASVAGQSVTIDWPLTTLVHLNALGGPCPPERTILDDHGHGTMTASRAAGNQHSLCPTCLIVEIEGLGADGTRWLADQPWVDVQSHSWLSLIPAPLENFGDNPADPGSVGGTFAYAAQRQVVVAASGNGAAYLGGFAPTPTYVLSTAAPGVFLVGGHDNGKVTAWSGAPTTVVADAYGGWTAVRDHLTLTRPDPIACCTSTAAPYAAGGAAALVREARRIVGDTTPGIQGGVVASGPTATARGVLDDGVLTLEEFSRIYRHTAQPRPLEGPDDGLVHWLGGAGDGQLPDPTLLLRHGPAYNPYCAGCWTLPVDWASVPTEANAWAQLGYGSVDVRSVALARAVLEGQAPEPDRALEDQLHALDQQVRDDLLFSSVLESLLFG